MTEESESEPVLYRFLWKCRRCHLKFLGDDEFQAEGKWQVHHTVPIASHRCDDDNIGFCDCIGAEPSKKAPEKRKKRGS